MSSLEGNVSTSISNRTRTIFRSAKDFFSPRIKDQVEPISGLEGKEKIVSSPIGASKSSLRGYLPNLFDTPALRSTNSAQYHINGSLGRTNSASSENDQKGVPGRSEKTASLTKGYSLGNTLAYPRWSDSNTPSSKTEMMVWKKRQLRSPVANVIKQTAEPKEQHLRPRQVPRYEFSAEQSYIPETIPHKPSWSNPIPSPTADVKRRSAIIRERLFKSTISTDIVLGPLFVPSSTYARIRPYLGKVAKVEIFGELERTQKMCHGQESSRSSCYSRCNNDEMTESSLPKDNTTGETVEELPSLLDAYAELSHTSAKTPDDQCDQSDKSSSTYFSDELKSQQPGDIVVSEKNLEPVLDYDSDEYFTRQVALLEADLASSSTSILQSKYFRKALRINDAKPRFGSDRDLEKMNESL